MDLIQNNIHLHQQSDFTSLSLSVSCKPGSIHYDLGSLNKDAAVSTGQALKSWIFNYLGHEKIEVRSFVMPLVV